ncbi:MAG: HipA domain-containing protein [Gemmatimonadaceae bacterium]|nr:HipA domain-containing protein [Gemmatimonadaceae bacterium]
METLAYDAEWVDTPNARPLSLTLPFTPGNIAHRGDVVATWFENLLPDSLPIRRRIARRFGTGSMEPRALLAAIGRDCVGAVQLLPLGEPAGDVRRIESVALAEHEVATILRHQSTDDRFGIGAPSPDADFRISIAGAQEKTALLKRDGAWHRPIGATPTTHILKLPLGLVGAMRADLHASVENEWLCLAFLRALGLRVTDASMATFTDEHGPVRALVVERFDRRLVARGADAVPWLARLPQEDLCQATATAPDRKYESDGGPGIARCVELLTRGSRPEEDTLDFALAQLAFWLLAATDGHAKNFSIFLRRDGFVMTPLYDVLSAWPIIGRGPGMLPRQKARLAMALRGTSPHDELARIHASHWRALADRLPSRTAWARMIALVDGAESAARSLERVLPADFPAAVHDAIVAGVLDHRQRFLDAVVAMGDARR